MLRRLVFFALCGFTVVAPAAHAASRSVCEPSMLAPVMPRAGSLVWRACDGSVLARFDYGASTADRTAYNETAVSMGRPFTGGLPPIPGTVAQTYLGLLGHSVAGGITYAAPLADRSQIVSTAITRGASYELVGYAFAAGAKTDPFHIIYQSGVYAATSSHVLFIKSPLAGLTIPRSVRVYFALLAVPHIADVRSATTPAPGNVANVTRAAALPSLTLTNVDNSYGAWVISYPSARYALTVGNAGTAATSGTITVTDTLPSGLQLRATPSGKGWTCTGAPSASLLSCTSKVPIPKGSSDEAITVPVRIGPSTPAGINAIANTANAYGGGDRVHATAKSAVTARVLTTIDLPYATAMVFLVKPTNKTWQVPSDWNPHNNSIEVIGGGAAGANGGGGGAYSKIVNVALTPGSIVGRTVGVGGGPTGNGDGGDTYLCSSLSNCGSLSASAVIVGAQGGSGNPYGQGGKAAAGAGAVRFSGGTANCYFDPILGAASECGGGGAAGRHGNGDDGDSYGDGGAGDAGFGGQGGDDGDTGLAGNGGNGSEFDARHGSGGGGTSGGSGGAYGGAGGTYSDDSGNFAEGNGSSGIIVISYAPTPSQIVPALTLTKVDNSGAGWAIGTPGARYTLTVGNAGMASTVGTITVTDALPSGLQLRTTPSGAGWTCSGAARATTLSCVSKTPIVKGSSGAPITVPVSVGISTPRGTNAITNAAIAYGGGDLTRSTPKTAAGAQRSTTIFYSGPALMLTKEDNSGGTWVLGAPGARYTLTVGNAGLAPTVGTITVTDTLPSGLQLRATPFGTGWSCTGATSATVLSCTSKAPIRKSSSGAPITVPVSIGPTTPVGTNAITNIADAYGGGDAFHAMPKNAVSARDNTTTANAAPVNVYVADFQSDLVEEIPAGSAGHVALGSGFNFPTGVAVDGAGNVFVADNGNSAVKEILAVGGYTTVKTLGSGLHYPAGVAVDRSGNVFVADVGNNAVEEIPATGGYTTVKTLGSGFNGPSGVAVDGAGNVFVGDTGNNAVKEILAAGGYATVKTLGSKFNEPSGVAIDRSGNVFVADLDNNAVKEMLAAGGYTTVKTLGSGFSLPGGVAVDGAGNVFVADTEHGVVKEILAAGGYATVITIGTAFSSPTAVAVPPPASPHRGGARDGRPAKSSLSRSRLNR